MKLIKLMGDKWKAERFGVTKTQKSKVTMNDNEGWLKQQKIIVGEAVDPKNLAPTNMIIVLSQFMASVSYATLFTVHQSLALQWLVQSLISHAYFLVSIILIALLIANQLLFHMNNFCNQHNKVSIAFYQYLGIGWA